MKEKVKNSNGRRSFNPSNLFAFAFCLPRKDFEETHLKALIGLAEPEKWAVTGAPHPYSVLFFYCFKTFARCYQQNKIQYSADKKVCRFNTGLLTKYGEEIYGFFTENPRRLSGNESTQKWFLKGFFKRSDRIMQAYCFDGDPELASYYDDPADLHFDPKKPIEIAEEHILDDHWERDQQVFPEKLKALGRPATLALIMDAFRQTKIRLKRNPRIAVPQFYNDKLMFLLPITIPLGEDTLRFAMAVEPMQNGNYRANTIFDLESAYKKARLVFRPESNWLNPDECGLKDDESEE